MTPRKKKKREKQERKWNGNRKYMRYEKREIKDRRKIRTISKRIKIRNSRKNIAIG